MKVTLDIRDDEELRLHIKDHIKGLYKSVISDSIREIATEILHEKLKNKNQHYWESVIVQAMVMIIREDNSLKYGNRKHPQNVLRLAAAKALSDYLGDTKSKEDLMLAIAKELTTAQP